jgi:Fe-S-cluster containining protein
MKTLSEKSSLLKLRALKNSFRASIRQNYEHRAKDCLTCETQGACCLDAHFVNVHITRLEAVLIGEELAKFSPEKQNEIYKRINEIIEKYHLESEGDTFKKTFACPLFEKGTGCLVHSVKPLPCIAHACYERREDLPPDDLQAEAEAKIEKLNEQTYRKFARWLALPVFLDLLNGD